MLLDKFRDETHSDAERLHDHSMRDFIIIAKLSKSIETSNEIAASILPEDGDSFLKLPESVSLSKVYTSEGTFFCRKNKKNELAQVELHCRANTIFDAKRKFSDVVLPFVDHLSYIANCPIYIPLLQVQDKKNHISSINYISPHPTSSMNPHEAVIQLDLLPIYALYREAKNNQSNFYKFICYYKILEGVFGPLRTKLFQQATLQGKPVKQIRDILPDHPELDSKFSSYIGKPIKNVFDKFLNKEFRNSIAHFVTDDKAVMNVSTYDSNAKFAGVVFMAELCARVVIENHRNYLKQLN